MQSFPKQKKKKRSKKKEPERPSIMHSKESGTCYLCWRVSESDTFRTLRVKGVSLQYTSSCRNRTGSCTRK